MNIAQIEESLQSLFKNFSKETFIYDFLLAYDTPKSILKRLKEGALNLSKAQGEILWKKKLLFKEVYGSDLHLAIDELKGDQKAITNQPRFIIVTDYETILAIDTKSQDSLDIALSDMAKHFAFFLPLAGMEKAQFKIENPADVKAAEKMAKLYDEIKRDNPTTTAEEVHSLNVFLSRLLFCFFAEDTEIFTKYIFTNSIKSHTQSDGSDLKSYLERLFKVLNTDYPNRNDLPVHLNVFQYVNGGLFREEYPIPQFTYKSRNAIIECGDLNWKDINPDIFGSMIQAVITPEHRGGLGMHYTSVPNIMKVIEPLFLNDLYEDFESNKNQPQKLENLLYRLSRLKIFDPACGSGNFLIIAYKELRFLEIKIIQRFEELKQVVSGFEEKQIALIPKAQHTLAAMYQRKLFSNIQLTQFYGIELDDFAHEVAMLSLWLAQHQMNMKFKDEFGQSNPTLPLKDGGNVTRGNATTLNWEVVCPLKKGDEIYILGNPPYLGSSMQGKDQKHEMSLVFQNVEGYKNLDYIACWFLKAANYIRGNNSQFAFVSTNSICQGEQVALLWPPLFAKQIEINFAHTSFKWGNNAKANAAVAVVIIGLRNISSKPKLIFNNGIAQVVENINPYLVPGKNIIIQRRTKSISDLPEMVYGNKPNDGGNLILNHIEREELMKNDPKSEAFIRKLIGSAEFIKNDHRWCLWIDNEDVENATRIDQINRRILATKKMRERSIDKGTNTQAERSHQFRDRTAAKIHSILIPRVGSSRRKYIPVGFMDNSYIISDSAQAIYDAEPYVFSILSSRLHITWVKSVAGYLKTDYRYSSVLCYNTFPFPAISNIQKQELEKHAYRILEERELCSQFTLAHLYDPNKMPGGLKEAHHQLDLAVERCYRSLPFESDDERLEYLFKLYEKIVTEEKSAGTLFEATRKFNKTKTQKDA